MRRASSRLAGLRCVSLRRRGARGFAIQNFSFSAPSLELAAQGIELRDPFLTTSAKDSTGALLSNIGDKTDKIPIFSMKVLFPRLLYLLRILAPPPLLSILSFLRGASFNLVLQKIKEFEASEKVLAQAWSSSLLYFLE